jgi:hypothetical protein
MFGSRGQDHLHTYDNTVHFYYDGNIIETSQLGRGGFGEVFGTTGAYSDLVCGVEI